ncbi:MAG TPA: winged helix-turn-helix domain-containing protein [Vicinamibacterales bacterium]|nr:winged helix-turn-helix domain-containing protein [Vicinamibacterales bacterium]
MIRFGPFQIDPRTWLLTRDSQAVDLSPRLVEILGFIVSKAGQIVTKDELLEKFWPGVNVTENTLTRAIADIRKAISDDAAEPQYLQTASRRGYRFIAGATAATGATVATSGDPFQDWVKGRLALDSLDASKLNDAVAAFERATAELPRYAPAHAGLANAYLLQYERTRFGSAPDRALLNRAMTAAREATTLDPMLGEAWAVLGYALCAAGKSEEGQGAGRRATALEPDNWRHHYRLAYGSWGEERLRAVDRALASMPGFVPARMLSCMVFVARGTMDRAEREAFIGADAQRQHQDAQTPLPAVGFHWLRGMILATRGDRAGALQCFAEEIDAGKRGHVYGHEFVVNAQVAAGFLHLADNNTAAASASFGEASSHPKAIVGMSAIDGTTAAVEKAIADLVRSERHAEAALVTAGAQIVREQIDEAVRTLDRLLASSPSGPAGWIIPIDPMLASIREPLQKSGLFAKLAARAA